jgi:hypothetical protein
LHAFSNFIDKQPKAASITINLQNCIVDLPDEAAERLRGLVFFERFIMELGYRLFKIYGRKDSPKNIGRKLTSRFNLFQSKSGLIQKSILNLTTFAYRGTSFGVLQADAEKISRTDKTTTSGEAGANLKLAFSAEPAQFQAIANGALRRQVDEIGVSEYVRRRYIDYAALKNDLSDLLEAIEIDTLYILVDEWTSVDRTGSTLIQPYLADFMKRAFHGNDRFCVKISSVKAETRLYTHEDQHIGLEVGDDVYDNIDLDAIYINKTLNLQDFYKELLFKRLRHCCAELSILSLGSDRLKPVEHFSTLIFEDAAAFDELIKGSYGIPRDFVILFDKISESYGHRLGNGWKKHRVRDIIVRDRINFQESQIKENALAYRLLPAIKRVIERNKIRLFLFDKYERPEVIKAVNFLLARRYIHEQDYARIPFDVRQRYLVFHIDYGCFLDWTRTIKDRKETEVVCPINDHTTVQGVVPFVVDFRCEVEPYAG